MSNTPVIVAQLPNAPAPVATGSKPVVTDHGQIDQPLIPSPSAGPQPGQAKAQLELLITSVEKQLKGTDIPEKSKAGLQGAVDLANAAYVDYKPGEPEEVLNVAYGNLQAALRLVAADFNAENAIDPATVGKSTAAEVPDTPVLDAGDTVKMIFPKRVLLTVDYTRSIDFPAGEHQVPVALSTHPYLALNGVKIAGAPIPAIPPVIPAAETQPGEAAKTAPVAK